MSFEGTENQTVSNEPTEQAAQDTQDTSKYVAEDDFEVSDDPWGEVKEKTWDKFDVSESDAEDDDQSLQEADGEADSHLEADEADQKPEDKEETEPNSEADPTELNVKYSLDDVRMPGKYKGEVQKKIDSILGEAKVQAQKLTEGYRDSNNAFAGAFLDIMQSENPIQRLHDYAKEYVPAYNLPPELISNLESKISAEPRQEGTQMPDVSPAGLNFGAIQQRLDQELTEIENKYWPELEKVEDDPARARQLFTQMEREKMAMRDAVETAKLQAILAGFYSKFVKPTKEQFDEIRSKTETEKAKAAIQSQKSLWVNADTQIKAKFQDWPKYRNAVKELLKTKFKQQTIEANQSGKGHIELMEDLYLIASRRDHLDAAKRPKLGQPGLKPSGKHIKTRKAGGASWDDIKQNHWPQDD